MIDLEKFHGRQSVLDLLKRRVVDLKEGYRQNIAFLGERYIGKSAALKKFITDIDDPQIVPIYIDLENPEFNHFFEKTVGYILHRFSNDQKLPSYKNIKQLIEISQPHLPQTCQIIKKAEASMLQGRLAESYREIMLLPQTFAQETNKFCIFILDEFQNLEEFPVLEVFQELGKQIMTQRRCLYVVASSFPTAAKKILSEKLSLLFGDFEVIEVEPFNRKSAQEFVGRHLENTKISEQVSHFFIDFTGGRPLYLKLICEEIINLKALHKQTEIFFPLLMEAIDKVLFNEWGVLNRHFDLTIHQLCSGKGNGILPMILVALAEGKQKAKELTQQTALKQGPLLQKVNRLALLDIVGRNGDYYYLKDKLFKYWVKHIFYKKRISIDFNIEEQRNGFRSELARAFQTFKTASQKDLSSRVIELLYCFDNESFQINGRRYKLPTFREIVPTKIRKGMGEYFDLIKGSTSEGDWIVILKTGAFSEKDVNAVLTESKKLDLKPQRWILVSPFDLDENTRLKALQERMWIWNEGELNALLHLYDKPYVVIS